MNATARIKLSDVDDFCLSICLKVNLIHAPSSGGSDTLEYTAHFIQPAGRQHQKQKNLCQHLGGRSTT
jgi:hypothetical protein